MAEETAGFSGNSELKGPAQVSKRMQTHTIWDLTPGQQMEGRQLHKESGEVAGNGASAGQTPRSHAQAQSSF